VERGGRRSDGEGDCLCASFVSIAKQVEMLARGGEQE